MSYWAEMMAWQEKAEQQRLRAEVAERRVAELEGFLTLRPYGHVGPEQIPWFRHGGISHAEGAECVVCRALLSGSTETPELPLNEWGRVMCRCGVSVFPQNWPNHLVSVTRRPHGLSGSTEP